MVMVSNNRGIQVGFLAGRFPGRIGHLYSPGGQRGPYADIPYALDNRAFSTWKRGLKWSVEEWFDLLRWAKLSAYKPMWALVPDVVGDRKGTLERWKEYSPVVRKFGWPLAFAVQDGMEPADIPKDAEVIFVGGTTKWKWRTVPLWCKAHPRVHVGRVNEYKALLICDKAGAESVDGTGWCRRPDSREFRQLKMWLEEKTGLRPPPPEQGELICFDPMR